MKRKAIPEEDRILDEIAQEPASIKWNNTLIAFGADFVKEITMENYLNVS